MNIIVTGASKGIGFQTVLRLNDNPRNKLVAIARNSDLLTDLKKSGKYPENIHPIPFDLKDFFRYKSELLKNILRTIKNVDVLINNAGLLINKSFETQNEEDFNLQMEINFKVPFMLTQLLLPYFNPNAHVLNISSMGGVQGSAKFTGLSAYSSSKAASAVLTECLAEELKDKEIKSNCLALGATQTEMLAEAFPGYTAPVMAADMGKYVADFAISGHKYFNGKILPVALTTP
ncbi:MAG: short-chain dehydrogenase [Bacteroidetes bacterium HGW-Bacteroidetes-17]|jgi:short-subunit dehydrogenase|nr:MAG: short-chain dehydrogenase [Bacteroidetes bacterium HGW-Bacteroidetes-17]